MRRCERVEDRWLSAVSIPAMCCVPRACVCLAAASWSRVLFCEEGCMHGSLRDRDRGGLPEGGSPMRPLAPL